MSCYLKESRNVIEVEQMTAARMHGGNNSTYVVRYYKRYIVKSLTDHMGYHACRKTPCMMDVFNSFKYNSFTRLNLIQHVL